LNRPPLRPDDALAAFSAFPAPVAVVAALVDGEPQGLVTSSLAAGISLVPPLLSFAVRTASSTWPTLRKAPELGVSLLAHTQEDISRAISMNPPPTRFETVETAADAGGAVLIAGAPVQMVCRIGTLKWAGDHHLVLLEILDTSVDDDIPPLLYHRRVYRALELGTLAGNSHPIRRAVVRPR